MAKRWNAAILSTFRQESLERLQALDALLVSLEKTPDDEEVFADAARELHTLKGSAKMLGVDPMAALTHKLEDVLSALGDGQLAPDTELFTAFLAAMDVIKELAEAFADDRDPKADAAPLLQALDQLLSPEKATSASPESETEPEPETESEAKPPTKPSVSPGPLAPPAPPEIVPVGTTKNTTGTADTAVDVSAAGGAPSPGRAILRDLTKAVMMTTGAEPDGKASVSVRPDTLRRADTIRAEISKLDTIMNLVGEAAISHIKFEAYLRQLAAFVRQCERAHKLALSVREDARSRLAAPSGLDARADATGELASLLKELRAGLREFRVRFDADSLENKLLLEALQQEVAEIRMLPVSTIFARFPRAVRDLAAEHGKQVELKIHGEETRLDQKVLENIEAPLVHILRNAVDHGIEEPERRQRLSKPAAGTIRMSAFQEGARIAIVVEDDGRGLDATELKEMAVQRGILTATEADGLSDREAPYLICVKGFSTASTVTDVSGRGVGMDVVKKMIEDCKGELAIDSTPGRGTTIKINLPLTLAVTQVLMVEVAKQHYCIPTLSIEMVRMVLPEQVQLVAGRRVVRVGRRSVPLVRLGALLGMADAGPELPATGVPAVFLSHARQRIAFIVDRLVAEQQIVIKSLGRVLRNVPNVAGATILGTGEVGIILHAPDLVQRGLQMAGKTVPLALSGPARKPSPATPLLPILVVEDAMTTREMERDILEAAGYTVQTAVNGRDGVEKSRRTTFGLFLIDLQMPIMDGFELARTLRASDTYAKTPIVILSSLDSEEDKKRGLAAGADAHLVKAEFSQDSLLDVVARFLGRVRARPQPSQGEPQGTR